MLIELIILTSFATALLALGQWAAIALLLKENGETMPESS